MKDKKPSRAKLDDALRVPMTKEEKRVLEQKAADAGLCVATLARLFIRRGIASAQST
jgi:hypothetical protein